jgi:uncharacterized protein YjbJ (UPF0337 family)
MSGDNSAPKVGKNTGNAGKGRPKGSKNKVTAKAKTAIEVAAEKLGGADRLVAWVKEDPANERVFWSQIYTKLLPLQVKGEDDKPIPIAVVERRIVKANN